MAVLFPVVLLLVAEGGLGLAGYGYKWRLFLPVSAHESLGSNVHFGERFFPRAIARKPLLVNFPREKTDVTYRIFLMGASAAAGIPEPGLGFGQILDVMLEESFPAADFEVINCSLTAINSHVVLPIAQECAGYDPDLVVVYLGNNEVIGPFNVGSSEERQRTELAEIRRTITLRRSKIGQLVQGLAEARMTSELLESWGGMAMYDDNRLAEGDAALDVVYANYERNLQDIVAAIVPTGAQVILSTVAANLRDNGPFASVHRPDLAAAERDSFLTHFNRGAASDRDGEFAAAITAYRLALALDDGYAELHFRLGRSLLAAGALADGRRHLQRALDLDALRFRAGTETNAVVRRVAGAGDPAQVHLFDAQALVDQWCAAAGTVPGDNLFYEHVHFNFQGNYLMASLLFDQVASLLPQDLQRGAQAAPEPPSREACAEALAMTPWTAYNMLSQMYMMVRQPPFTNQSNQGETLAWMTADLERMKGEATETDPEDFVRAYQRALAGRPDDLLLRFGFAKLLADLGRPRLAGRETEYIQNRLPAGVFTTASRSGR